MIKKDKKSKIVKAYGVHKDDTGSSEVQVAILTERIKELTAHLKENPKDNHSRKGLLQMVAKRKKLLKDIQGRDGKRYEKITKALKLKAPKSAKEKENNQEQEEDEENQ